jgi:hypothetical protein
VYHPLISYPYLRIITQQSKNAMKPSPPPRYGTHSPMDNTLPFLYAIPFREHHSPSLIIKSLKL